MSSTASSSSATSAPATKAPSWVQRMRTEISGLSATSAAFDGSALLATSLYVYGVRHIFGVVGVPVVELSVACQSTGIAFYGFRHESSASYAASLYGYLSSSSPLFLSSSSSPSSSSSSLSRQHGPAGVCLSVSGPGVIHSLPGVANAKANCFPFLLISGSHDDSQSHAGAFQEIDCLPHVVAPLVKFGARIPSVDRIPFYVEKALRVAVSGRPGPCYLELPADMLEAPVDVNGTAARRVLDMLNDIRQQEQRNASAYVSFLTELPRSLAPPSSVELAVSKLLSAKRPLLVLGKGAASSGAEHVLKHLHDALPIPFLPSPMAKGLISDEHYLNASTSRSTALARADVFLIIGARLNWLFHFGAAPRFPTAGAASIIQIDIEAEELSNNRPVDVALCGNIPDIVQQIVEELKRKKKVQSDNWKDWIAALAEDGKKNAKEIERRSQDLSTPLSYYAVFAQIRPLIDSLSSTSADTSPIIVSEGANTMDISRTVLQHRHPRTRLDAGTLATMGIGLGYAIAAAVLYPQRLIVGIYGDSAFGFSMSEWEVCVRYGLRNVCAVVFNNSGIYAGTEELESFGGDARKVPATALSMKTRYEKLSDVLGGRGLYVETAEQVKQAMELVKQEWKTEGKLKGPTIINVIIRTSEGRKQQKHSWLTKSKL